MLGLDWHDSDMDLQDDLLLEKKQALTELILHCKSAEKLKRQVQSRCSTILEINRYSEAQITKNFLQAVCVCVSTIKYK